MSKLIRKYQNSGKISQELIDKANATDRGEIRQANDSWRSRLSKNITRFQEAQPEGVKMFGSFIPGYGEALDATDTAKAFSTGDNWDKAIAVGAIALPFVGNSLLKKTKPYLKEALLPIFDRMGLNVDGFGKKIEKIGSSKIPEGSLLEREAVLESGAPAVHLKGQVTYPNKSTVGVYIDPKTGVEKTFLGLPNMGDESQYIGYKRAYETKLAPGKFLPDQVPMNRFSITADMPNASSEDVKDIVTNINKVLPRFHELYEPKTISTDGLNMWKNQLKNGYVPTGEFTTPILSGSSKMNAFKGRVTEGSNKFGDFIFDSKEEKDRAAAEITEFFKKHKLPGGVDPTTNNKVRINLPILKRTFGLAAPLGIYGIHKLQKTKED